MMTAPSRGRPKGPLPASSPLPPLRAALHHPRGRRKGWYVMKRAVRLVGAEVAWSMGGDPWVAPVLFTQSHHGRRKRPHEPHCPSHGGDASVPSPLFSSPAPTRRVFPAGFLFLILPSGDYCECIRVFAVAPTRSRLCA